MTSTQHAPRKQVHTNQAMVTGVLMRLCIHEWASQADVHPVGLARPNRVLSQQSVLMVIDFADPAQRQAWGLVLIAAHSVAHGTSRCRCLQRDSAAGQPSHSQIHAVDVPCRALIHRDDTAALGHHPSELRGCS